MTAFSLLYLDDSMDEHLLFHTAATHVHAPLRILSVATPETAMGCLGVNPQPGITRCRRPAMILLDFQLVGEDCLPLLAWIRARSRLRKVPIIIYSGSDQPQIVRRCYQAGANAFLRKPVGVGRIEEIVSAIVRCLQSRPIDLAPLTTLPEYRSVSSGSPPSSNETALSTSPDRSEHSLTDSQPKEPDGPARPSSARRLTLRIATIDRRLRITGIG